MEIKMKKLNKITIMMLTCGTLFGASVYASDSKEVLSIPLQEVSVTTQAEQAVMVKSNFITNVDFLYKEKDMGVVEITLNKNDVYNVKTLDKENEVHVTLTNAYLPPHLHRKMVVGEFDTTVKTIDTFYENENTVIKLTLKEPSSVHIEDAGGKISLVVKKKTSASLFEENQYIGEPVTVEFQDIAVREALRILAKYTDFNLVTTDSVAGNITVSLKDVPFDHALDVILQSKGLNKKVTENIIYIAPAEELLKMEEDKLTARNKIANLAELRSRFFQIKYAKAKDISLVAEALITERGKIIVDERTNNVIVKDIAPSLRIIEETIAKLDIPIRQVLIEARIVIARKSKSHELGVRWGGVSFDGKNYLGSNFETTIENFTNESFYDAGKTAISSVPAVNLGVSNPAASFSLGVLTDTGLLDLELSAMEANGDGEIIARPKLLTADKKKATIKSGSQLPYQQSAGGGGGATTIAFKDAVLMLEVTPQITPDDRIIMDLKVHQDSIGQLTSGGPAIDTTQIETQVLVNNGETIVLGGVFQSEVIDDVKKVPLLGDLPAIGKLFRNTVKQEKKTELLIFITPKLIDNDVIY
jgi:type IV pilus assembly protein PilQ